MKGTAAAVLFCLTLLKNIGTASAEDWSGLSKKVRIHGGDEAQMGEFNYVVFVLIKTQGKIVFCSGSLVEPNWVLIAAQCLHHKFLRREDVMVIGGNMTSEYFKKRLSAAFNESIQEGEYEAQERRISGFHLHPNFTQSTLYHDLALMHLRQPFANGTVAVANMSFENIEGAVNCTSVGWGLSEGNEFDAKLKFVANRVGHSARLTCKHKESGPFICLRTHQRGICQGDMGSPLICGGRILGVASHSFYNSTPPVCGDADEDYYAALSDDEKWIDSVIGKSDAATMSSIFLQVVACVMLSIRCIKL